MHKLYIVKVLFCAVNREVFVVKTWKVKKYVNESKAITGVQNCKVN